MLKKLPIQVQDFIDKWFELEIENKKLPAPYFINQGGFLKKPVFAGKGSLEEIQEITTNLVSGKDLNIQEILDFMHEKGIGIDCSGLVYQIYDFWLQNTKNIKLSNYLPKIAIWNIRKYLSRKQKPQNSMSADEFTSEPFSSRIELKDVEPGDLIRTRSGKHVLLVTEVEIDKKDKVTRIKFIQSARQYNRDGIRYGEIVLDEKQNLNISNWDDDDKNEPINFAFEGWREGVNTNGIFRPKFFKELEN